MPSLRRSHLDNRPARLKRPSLRPGSAWPGPLGFRLMAKSSADTDTTDLLPNIEVPTLDLWGDDDRRSPMHIAVARCRSSILRISSLRCSANFAS